MVTWNVNVTRYKNSICVKYIQSTFKHVANTLLETSPCRTSPNISIVVRNLDSEKKLLCQKPERQSIKTDHWGVPVCYASKYCNLNSHFMHAWEWAKKHVYIFFSVAKRSLPQGLKWHSGGLIILLPHPASGCDMPIISGPRINSVIKERSLAPARPERGYSWDYARGSRARQKRLLPAFLQWNSKV